MQFQNLLKVFFHYITRTTQPTLLSSKNHSPKAKPSPSIDRTRACTRPASIPIKGSSFSLSLSLLVLSPRPQVKLRNIPSSLSSRDLSAPQKIEPVFSTCISYTYIHNAEGQKKLYLLGLCCALSRMSGQ